MDGVRVSHVRTGDDLRLRLTWTASSPVPQTVFGIAVYTVAGQHVTGPNTLDVGRLVDCSAAGGAVEVLLPGLALVPGEYDVAVAVYDPTLAHAYDHHERAFRLDVRPGDPTDRAGVVSLGSRLVHRTERGGPMTAGRARWDGDDAVRLPFDQYQRYTGAARVVDRLVGDADYSMLEVGGAPGFPEVFFGASRLAVVDRFGRHDGNFVVVDGARLPFDDETFDVVVTLDTLEHIVPEDRPAFLAECRRVSRDLVVLSAPHATAHVVEAELALQSFVTARFGEVFETLQEHADRGLPLAEETAAGLGADGWACVSMPSGYLPRWLMGMVAHHELLAVGVPELPDLHAFYNRLMGPYDNQEPGYRRLVVASRTRAAGRAGRRGGRSSSPARPRVGRTPSCRPWPAGCSPSGSGFGNAEQVRRARDHDGLVAQLAARTGEVEALRQQLGRHVAAALGARRAGQRPGGRAAGPDRASRGAPAAGDGPPRGRLRHRPRARSGPRRRLRRLSPGAACGLRPGARARRR